MRTNVIENDSIHFCPTCHEPIERILNFPVLDGKGGSTPRKVRILCKCQQAEKEAYDKRMEFEEKQRKINALRQLSLMDQRLVGVSFDSYQVTEDNQKAFKIAKNFVCHFKEMYENHQGLLLWGDVGSGKSYTAAAIANELIERQVPVIMTSFIRIINEMDGRDKDNRFIDRLKNAKVLIIDDLGAERCSDYTLEKVYDIIDSWYRSNNPLIITTNLELGYMKKCDDIRYSRIYDRIFEMCYPVKVSGFSWRKKEAAARFGDMKKILEG